MPRYSTGFCVATTMKGCGRGRRSESMVTAPSFIASSSADCVLGVARLISSARTMLAKIGPGVELEPLGRRMKHGDPEHVGRERVARELDPPELEREAPPERPRERRLAHARDILDQDVPAGEQRRQDEVHGPRVAAVDEPHVLAQARQARGDSRFHRQYIHADNSTMRRFRRGYFSLVKAFMISAKAFKIKGKRPEPRSFPPAQALDGGAQLPLLGRTGGRGRRRDRRRSR